jgi:hypothetical protein
MSMLRAKALCLACGAAALVGAAFMFSGISVPSAQATPAYAQQTGQPCGTCHVNKAGGGKLTAKGEHFQKNGHKM